MGGLLQALGDDSILPNIDFGAATAHGADTGVGVVGRWLPSLNVALAADELEITSALGVAVLVSRVSPVWRFKAINSTHSCAVFGTSLVGRVLGHATILVHGDKVQGRVQAALDGREIDIEGELVVHEGEHLVLGGAIHEVETRADVGAVLVLREELEGEGVAAGRGAICLAVVGTLEGALRGAVGGAAAGIGPLVAVVAVLDGGARRVQPAPVRVDDHLGIDRCARRFASALLPAHLGVCLGCLLANLLGRRRAHQRQAGEILKVLHDDGKQTNVVNLG